ncbi:MAG: hypothetical protein J6Q82_06985 [Clostridia bacterium]|nr:hypothetical protein [Clostridia bacterium]
MYSRRELGDRYPRVPRNYSGNAFREEAPPAPSEPIEITDAAKTAESIEEAPPTELAPTGEESIPAARSGLFSHTGALGGLFRQGGSIGSEELLLLGLILLLSQNETQDDLLPLLLILLLIR